ncbi:hypothetical protein [Nostoc sp. NMS8]|uniref:hypothetical protein n=1 Tax=Nostoc sp. NMS8 TaxID=2815392 RepID=UPI0025E765F0|nr:hypothetical protein [Nostoc sp. NMS8]
MGWHPRQTPDGSPPGRSKENRDLDAPSVPFPRERTYPAEYTEAIAQIKEQHKQELERLSQKLKIGLQAEAGAKAEAQVQEQIQSLQNLYKQEKDTSKADAKRSFAYCSLWTS